MSNVSEYNKPLVLAHQQICFETAHSWNKGIGNKNPSSDGNGGIHYPLPPRPGKVPPPPSNSNKNKN